MPENALADTKINHNQATIPKVIQEELGLKDGDRIMWFKINGEIIVRKGVLKAEERKLEGSTNT